MTLAQTKTLLSYIWSAIPCAPRMDPQDKKRIAAAYCITLHEYSADDVMTATVECCRKSSFVPSAFEILNYCHKTLHTEQFYSNEYHDRLDELYALECRIKEKRLDAECAYKTRANGRELSDEENAVLDDYFDLLETKKALETEVSEMETRAHIAAMAAYDGAEKKALLAEFGEKAIERIMQEVE